MRDVASGRSDSEQWVPTVIESARRTDRAVLFLGGSRMGEAACRRPFGVLPRLVAFTVALDLQCLTAHMVRFRALLNGMSEGDERNRDVPENEHDESACGDKEERDEYWPKRNRNHKQHGHQRDQENCRNEGTHSTAPFAEVQQRLVGTIRTYTVKNGYSSAQCPLLPTRDYGWRDRSDTGAGRGHALGSENER